LRLFTIRVIPFFGCFLKQVEWMAFVQLVKWRLAPLEGMAVEQ